MVQDNMADQFLYYRDAHDRPMRDQPLPLVEALFPPLIEEENLAVWEGEGKGLPNTKECAAFWDIYAVPPHIRAHSRQVSLILECLGELLRNKGVRLNRALLLAGGLLHDIAKAYTIHYGGNHGQLGAAWMVREGVNPRVAQMILHHIHWPWKLDVYNETMLPSLLLAYADKRIQHDAVVGLDTRFKDLMLRYGHTEQARFFITSSWEQGQDLEKNLSFISGVDLNEYTFGCRRMV